MTSETGTLRMLLIESAGFTTVWTLIAIVMQYGLGYEIFRATGIFPAVEILWGWMTLFAVVYISMYGTQKVLDRRGENNVE